MLIDLTLHTSLLIVTHTSLPEEPTTMSTQTVTAPMTTTTSAFGPTPTAQQRITTAMQKAFQQKGKGMSPPGGSGGPSGRGGSGPPGGGGSGPPGGGGPGQLLAPQQPVQVAADVKSIGSLPQIFTGDQAKADDFIKEVKGYFHLNADIAGYNSPYKKVAFTLTLIKGNEPAQWVQNMGNWLDTLNPVADNDPRSLGPIPQSICLPIPRLPSCTTSLK